MLSWHKIQKQYFHLDTYDIGVLALLLLAVGLRVVLVNLGWPLLDSDEGTMGLMGMHIAYRGEKPIFFYAQGYMGAAEAYLAGWMFFLFGVSTFTLRFGVILMFTIFLSGLYLITRLLYSKRLALIILLLFALGSNTILNRELIVVGGDPETLLCGALLLLIAFWLALTSTADFSLRHRPRRMLAYAFWGLLAGLGIWSHMLVIPFILAGLLMMGLFCWRELLGVVPVLLVLCFCIGAAPFLYYNLKAPLSENSFTLTFRVHHSNDMPQPGFNVLFPRQVENAFFITLPSITGLHPVCHTNDVHLDSSRWKTPQTTWCSLLHISWTSGILALWLLAFLLTVKGLWLLLRRTSREMEPLERRRSIALEASRLTLLLTAAMTFLLYMLSSNAAFYPVASTRYQIGLLITAPAVLSPLVDGAALGLSRLLRVPQRVMQTLRITDVLRYLRVAILLLVVVVSVLGTDSVLTGFSSNEPLDDQGSVYVTQTTELHLAVPQTRMLNQQEADLIHDLESQQVKHIYSDYWTCNRLIFQSREQIICKALNDDLQGGHDRYPPYPQAVHKDPFAAYVFHIKSAPARNFIKDLKSGKAYHGFLCHVMAGYQVCVLPHKK